MRPKQTLTDPISNDNRRLFENHVGRDKRFRIPIIRLSRRTGVLTRIIINSTTRSRHAAAKCVMRKCDIVVPRRRFTTAATKTYTTFAHVFQTFTRTGRMFDRCTTINCPALAVFDGGGAPVRLDARHLRFAYNEPTVSRARYER